MRNLSILSSMALLIVVSCGKDGGGPVGPSTTDSFQIKTVISRAIEQDANPEIVRIVPGTDNRAVFVSSAVNRLTLIDYMATDFNFSSVYALDPGSATSEMTAIDVSPDGQYIAVTVAEVDCAKGWILLVKISDGTIEKRIEVGYNPDSAAFSNDGKWIVVSNEDDREDRPCKPAERFGGSVSVIDLSVGVADAEVTQEIRVDHAEDSEPEGVEISPDNNTVIVSVQETSEIGIFELSDVPDATMTFVALPDVEGVPAEPDGLAISPDGAYALISNEKNGSFSMMSLPDGTLLSTHFIEDDVPAPPYNIDQRKSTKRTEPEECVLIEKDGKLYALISLQESHAVVVYDVTDPTDPKFDSIAPTGVDYENDISMEKSIIGTEGLSAHPENGIVFTANEREGSITMLSALWARETALP